jgi:hypothetical protein
MSVILTTETRVKIALAVCYIRMHKITMAMPYINDVLANAGKDAGESRQLMINKFKEELIESTLNNDSSVAEENSEVKKTYSISAKKVFHESLCNPESDIYKFWNNNVVQLLLSKKAIGAMLVSCLAFKLDTRLLAASFIALVFKFGVEVFCEKCRSRK